MSKDHLSGARPSGAIAATLAARRHRGPFVGALLRMTWETLRARLLAVLAAQGFGDISQSHFPIFQYPPPDGVRAIDVAHKAGMTKQAMNYLLQQVEAAGYIKRRAGAGQRNLIYLTPRGWQLTETIWVAVQQIEAEWAQHIGPRRFAEFLDTLQQLVALSPATDRLPSPAAVDERRRKRRRNARVP